MPKPLSGQNTSFDLIVYCCSHCTSLFSLGQNTSFVRIHLSSLWFIVGLLVRIHLLSLWFSVVLIVLHFILSSTWDWCTILAWLCTNFPLTSTKITLTSTKWVLTSTKVMTKTTKIWYCSPLCIITTLWIQDATLGYQIQVCTAGSPNSDSLKACP